MTDTNNEFEREGRRVRRGGIVSEFIGFLWTTKKWWLIPLVLVIFALVALGILGGTGAAPFIYTVF